MNDHHVINTNVYKTTTMEPCCIIMVKHDDNNNNNNNNNDNNNNNNKTNSSERAYGLSCGVTKDSIRTNCYYRCVQTCKYN